MVAYLRCPLVIVWALLVAVTVVSWLTARDGGAAHVLDATVTVVVLLIAATKTVLVMWHFMEIKRAPRWLQATTAGWAIAVFALLLGCYFGRG
ncbi:hypothetical protein MMAD_00730 [Mycolicibacterium madagascariense]|uniref:Prokaryotic cytochrome C oxidase subunit IV family protein n=1 Tax=Mycolicibacterium madagascariense TaxID=212765 RepID=A0A7I7XBP7_9MYCO|nr:cytochrome C oxidase subunit IV family protein [Mycolicibacterium madagascariense]MCV7014169.1 cytochrome C oxidase subunit IV family protein [Mycolicibacterium madagascariense]BBZ25778.1 hypothetical protein MMAD_00730 [Mycolicibacterium madagascariense]